MGNTWVTLVSKLGGITPLYPHRVIPNRQGQAHMGGRPLGRQAAFKSGWLAPPTATTHPPLPSRLLAVGPGAAGKEDPPPATELRAWPGAGRLNRPRENR